MTNPATVKAVIWDFDGTLVDSREKNYRVTLEIIRKVIGKNPEKFSILKSLENYTAATHRYRNWRELYREEYHFDDALIDLAGSLWTPGQLQDSTPIPLFGGVQETLEALGNIPHGIVSQNSRDNIIKVLRDEQLDRFFGCIIGYEEVEMDEQKPHPAGLLACLEKLLGSKEGIVCYVGDHETDAECVQNTNELLRRDKNGPEVVSIAAVYGGAGNIDGWDIKPHFLAHSVSEVAGIVEMLNRRSRYSSK